MKADAIVFPATLTSRRDDPQVAEFLEAEETIFEAGRQGLEGKREIYGLQILQLEEEIASLRAQLTAREKQRELNFQQKARIERLIEEGIMEDTRLLPVHSRIAELEGEIGEDRALIARAQQGIGETKLLILDLENTFRSSVASQIKEVHGQLADIEDRIAAAEDRMVRTEIRAPQAGRVVDLQLHTTGGVITPGQRIMDIVPADDLLVIEAMIKPTDIDVVHEGLPAQVKLTAYKQRSSPLLDGRVTRVSADAFTEPRTGAPYYKAQIEIDASQKEKLDNARLHPGMQADVMILTGEQSTFSYIISPLRDSFGKAFREN